MQDFMRTLHLISSKKKRIRILHRVKGIIRPSRMTLLLGSPGSGKSTLLRALSGKLSSSVECTGKVIYNKNPPGPSAQHTCVYISQYDLHHAEMTVSETLDFCSHMFGTNNEFRSLGANINKLDKANNSVTCEGRVNLIVDYIIKLLGLKECAGITIGDEMRRGISGGQKKRVTIGEMLVSFARSFFMDDISNGLDSSTTFEIIRFLSQMAHLMDIAMVISLLQPPPETFELFDDIILLSEGEIVYQGPRENVLEFFEYMGFKCSERKNTADFLQEQFLAFFSMHQTSMALFRFIAAVGRTQVMANTLGTAALVAIYILGGFVVSKDNIQPWLVWGYWASPLTYAQNAVTLNEFLDERWSMPIHYEGINANTAGKVILKSRGLMVEWHWYWICVGILLGYSMIFNVLSIFALEYLNPLFKHQVNIDPRYKDAQLTEQLDKLTAREPSPKCQLVLPFKPLTLVFKHINYYVDMPAAMKKHNFNAKTLQLLRDVSGAFKPGILTALMGVTGAGKTTLLDVLSGRKTGGCIEGTITINGYPKRQETFARISGYCEQTDVHSPFITVYESLQFSAWLRLPSNIEEHQRNMFVEEVMGLVELLPLRNAIVGIPGVNGLSAEQRKRLTIAVELVSSPSIIFMDEPTSGLDARSAAIVMRAVRKTVDTGRTVVCTIHQPSIEIFEAFDELMLMKRGGQLIYSGPLGSLSCNLIQYFEAIPRCPKMKNGQNPAAWMLDVSSPAMEYTISVDYADIFQNSSVYEENMKQVEELSKRKDSNDLHFTSKYEQNLQYQFVACLWKHLKSYWKNPEHNVVRFVNTFMVALLFGLVFWQVGSKITSEQDIFNILGAVYASAMFLGFANSSIVQPYVAMERTVFYRERSSGMYSCMPYAFAQIAVEIPYTIAQVLIFSVIVYSMIGFQFTIAKFFWFTLFILLSFTYFILYGMMTVALTPTQEIAAGLSFLIFMMWNTFSGFYIPIKMIPIWWRWFYWASPPAWTIYGLMFSQLGDRVEIIRVPGYQDQTVKEFLVDYLGLQDDHIPLIVALHVVVIILFSFLFTLGIKHLNFQKR
ncbi:ABC transporter G family member 45-like isoform X5 [Asparagus officinalis]|uniref:ABC transporter G family member 45-like isoform X5 n=1 Tax=Asparagus officinalis TaxID=4686 RepID=UPI00098E76A0|nr:ABC transporter G family member 45-like isoform X5 [Asparagus officinalis]